MAWLLFETRDGEAPRALGPSTVLGRHPDCTVQILDRIASKHHCAIEERGGRYYLHDLGSLNGTTVNRTPVRGEVALADGDRVQIGSVVARFVEALPEGAAPAGAAPVIVPASAPHGPLPAAGPPAGAERATEETVAWDRGREPPVENGLLLVGQGGDVRLRLWNVRVDRGGFVLRIPLAGDRPPSSRLYHYIGKGSGDEIVLEDGDLEFDELLREATAAGGALPEPERVRFLADLVFRKLGGRLSPEAREACRAMCAAYAGRPMPIGELIRIGAGVCRHRAFLFFHLAERLGLRALLYRGAVPGGRHAWNEVRIGAKRVFVDPTLDVVLDDALEAEQAYGYHASRYDAAPRLGEPLNRSRILLLGGGDGERVELPYFRHELRKVPSDEEAVLLLYPDRELPDVRYLYVHFVVGAAATAMFRLDPFVSARVFSIVGDEAHYLADTVDRERLEELRRAWAGRGGT